MLQMAGAWSSPGGCSGRTRSSTKPSFLSSWNITMKIVRNSIERGTEVMEKEGSETPKSGTRRVAIRVGGQSNLRKK
jgi:hypothetical protein